LIAIPIVFQPEIRRALERVGRTSLTTIRGREASEQMLDVIAAASRDMAKRRHGALMVIERETGLEDYISTGRRIDAEPSEELIAGVFYRNSPLHDGAMILRGDRIVAAACTLPLSNAPLPQQYGTRHRAALGITELTDAVSVVVSEETGEVSVAADGHFTHHLDDGGLRATLQELVGSGVHAADGSVAASDGQRGQGSASAAGNTEGRRGIA
jgi:diadenylate cyclase